MDRRLDAVRSREGELSLAKHRLEMAERGLREQEAILEARDAGGGMEGDPGSGKDALPESLLTLPVKEGDGLNGKSEASLGQSGVAGVPFDAKDPTAVARARHTVAAEHQALREERAALDEAREQLDRARARLERLEGAALDRVVSQAEMQESLGRLKRGDAKGRGISGSGRGFGSEEDGDDSRLSHVSEPPPAETVRASMRGTMAVDPEVMRESTAVAAKPKNRPGGASRSPQSPAAAAMLGLS